jgi:alpha-tubulin suppressor-like RCC1 family protein
VKHFLPLGLAALLLSCGQLPKPSQNVLGSLELNLSSTSTLQTQTSTLREGDATFTALGNASVSTDGAFDYLQAQFTVQNTSSSAFDNLTLYAVAKSSNISGTAISSITNFAGVTDTTEQSRLVKLVTPIHAAQFSSGVLKVVDEREDFQAFSSDEANAIKTSTNWTSSGFSSSDAVLNYGFVARRCTANCGLPSATYSRDIPAGQGGVITVALRVPKGSSTSYNFRMTFAVVNESIKRFTRSVYPAQNLADAEELLGLPNTNELMQIGLTRGASQSSTFSNTGTDTVFVSSNQDDYTALGLGRMDAGDAHTCALSSAGQAYCWGINTAGGLGDATNTNRSVPTTIRSNASTVSSLRFSQISAGALHTCALTLEGQAYCWGSNEYGQLGIPTTISATTTPQAVRDSSGTTASTLRFSRIDTGKDHTCAITTVGAAYCWGRSLDGILGDNQSSTDRTYPGAVLDSSNNPSSLVFAEISLSTEHTCGITTTNIAYCWGKGLDGRLGNNLDISNKLTPVTLKDDTNADSTLRFLSITTGFNHTCGITTSQVAYCWGSNFRSQLGDATAGNKFVPVRVKDSISADSVLLFASLSAGTRHTCGITTDGVAYCWGDADSGKLGNNATTGTSDVTSAVQQTGGAASTLRFSSISSTANHTCGITTTGLGYCWGLEENGLLGNNVTTTTNQSVPTRDSANSFGL